MTKNSQCNRILAQVKCCVYLPFHVNIGINKIMLNLFDVIASVCKNYFQKKIIVQRKFAKIGSDDFLVFCCYLLVVNLFSLKNSDSLAI